MNVVATNGHEHDRDGLEKMCSSKHRYDTKKNAKSSVAVWNRTRKRLGEPPLHPYKCPYCGYYHVTSLERNSRAKA